MSSVFEATRLTKRFDRAVALENVDVEIPKHSIVGLIGKNGSGKTTLLRHLLGLYVATDGECTTLGRPSHRLTRDELVRIGSVPQECRLLDWMSVEYHIRYVASFYPRWDRERERRLCDDLELDRNATVGALSPGNAQKLAIVLALCHHPDLVILDEPVSALDPIARNKLLGFLVELIAEDDATIVVSSHVLRDIEQIVDRILCLDHGHVVGDASLDDLKDRFAEWRVTTRTGSLPGAFDESFVLRQDVNGRQALITVQAAESEIEAFELRHGVDVEIRPLNLERIFPLLLEEGAA